MKKNVVQFQRGLSLPAFLARYGSEEQCREALIQQRWPQGFVCPQCAHAGHCHLAARGVFQCNRCKHQVSPTSGTVFADTKLPLRTWFLAIYLLTQNKNGISALSLRRQLGVSPNTAWLLKHKLMQTMCERDEDRALSGIVPIDDAYWGGGVTVVALVAAVPARRLSWLPWSVRRRGIRCGCAWTWWPASARPYWPPGPRVISRAARRLSPTV